MPDKEIFFLFCLKFKVDELAWLDFSYLCLWLTYRYWIGTIIKGLHTDIVLYLFRILYFYLSTCFFLQSVGIGWIFFITVEYLGALIILFRNTDVDGFVFYFVIVFVIVGWSRGQETLSDFVLIQNHTVLSYLDGVLYWLAHQLLWIHLYHQIAFIIAFGRSYLLFCYFEGWSEVIIAWSWTKAWTLWVGLRTEPNLLTDDQNSECLDSFPIEENDLGIFGVYDSVEEFLNSAYFAKGFGSVSNPIF